MKQSAETLIRKPSREFLWMRYTAVKALDEIDNSFIRDFVVKIRREQLTVLYKGSSVATCYSQKISNFNLKIGGKITCQKLLFAKENRLIAL